MKNIVGPRVREARRSSTPPLTQVQLAAKLQVCGWDIDRGGVAKIEAGLRQVLDTEVLILAGALDVSPNWLLGVK